MAVRVEDNYGDAGVALRLLRAFSFREEVREVRLFIDRPEVLETLTGGTWRFGGPGTVLRLNPEGEAGPDDSGGRLRIRVFDWEFLPEPREGRPDMLLELFGGGIPEAYLTRIIGEGESPSVRIPWFNLEYLTAEPWAEEYHLVASHSPHPALERRFFMPGFTPGTGGLILDRGFLARKEFWDPLEGEERARARRELFRRWNLSLPEKKENRFWISVFSYRKDFRPLIRQLRELPEALVLLSPGPAREAFLEAVREEHRELPVTVLPFLPQEEWDRLLPACDLNLIRGEESLSRAALSGRPFLWQAYPLEGGEQLVKVEAFCRRLCPDDRALGDLFLRYNGPYAGEPGTEEDYRPLWREYRRIRGIFQKFSRELLANGDCAGNVLKYFGDTPETSA